ncbi:hypothetical protein KHC33_14070 [Methanospirillum sp. J.3.6.1-F.2.7.3]|uniref:Uncharacterized protein n=1 Tax=Methanospirillum purgamenti TaxID=2834276 RepID=A0A8E7B048_9EURY|nr:MULTISPECIES: hypothetical protein [Methanospirillum]MDX8551296.1 hypothetical protein [Methanospirillum hungatei]QVV88434.1 hypothetical protein KHC33_14070 [Methanospirillum sp. J.3.6.1-F.2.7.3]
MTEIITRPEIKEEARRKTREILSENKAYLSLPIHDQREIYLSLIEENVADLNKQFGLARPMGDSGADMGYKGFDPGFDKSVDAFEDLVDSVDFPKFVADLLKGVFDANISVMKAQTDSYIKLLKEATKGIADFIKDIGDDDTFAYLAETKKEQFNILMETQPDGSSKMALTDPQGEKVDPEDTEVKAKIMEAKISMAKEHRAALREVILMGVTRLVVEKGEVEAAVEYKITAKRESKVKKENKNINVLSAGGSIGFFGIGGNISVTNTNISINTSSKEAKDEMSAKLMGKVNIKFKTDYFKLDNFAQMYGEGGIAAIKQGGQPAPVQAAPTQPVPP